MYSVYDTTLAIQLDLGMTVLRPHWVVSVMFADIL